MSTIRAEYSPGTSVRERWVRLSNVPLRFRSTRLDELDQKSLPRVQAWVKKVLDGEVVGAIGSPLLGKGLILQGEPGHGKTTMACAATMEILRKVNPQILRTDPTSMPQRPVYYTTYPELLRTQKQSWDGDEMSQTIIDRAFGDVAGPFALLVLDDIGKEHQTGSGWAENVFDQIFRRRFDLGLPTIVTTNLPVAQWADTYGKPMASFAHEAAYILDIIAKGGDRRG